VSHSPDDVTVLRGRVLTFLGDPERDEDAFHLQGSNLMTSFIYRRFDGSSPTPVKVYHGVESRSLHAFPPKTDADLAAAARDLVLAFKSTARSFVSQRATPAAQP